MPNITVPSLLKKYKNSNKCLEEMNEAYEQLTAVLDPDKVARWESDALRAEADGEEALDIYLLKGGTKEVWLQLMKNPKSPSGNDDPAFCGSDEEEHEDREFWDDDEGDWEAPEEEAKGLALELMSIWMPSSIGAAKLTELGLHDLLKEERELRIGQANDCLDQLRTDLGNKAMLEGTRTKKEIQKVVARVNKHVRSYQRARQAILRLDPDGNMAEKYQEILPEDLAVSKEVTEENRFGQGTSKLAWFWVMDGEKNQLNVEAGGLMEESIWRVFLPHLDPEDQDDEIAIIQHILAVTRKSWAESCEGEDAREEKAHPTKAGDYKKAFMAFTAAQRIFKEEMDAYDRERRDTKDPKTIGQRNRIIQQWWESVSDERKAEAGRAAEKQNKLGAPKETHDLYRRKNLPNMARDLIETVHRTMGSHVVMFVAHEAGEGQIKMAVFETAPADGKKAFTQSLESSKDWVLNGENSLMDYLLTAPVEDDSAEKHEDHWQTLEAEEKVIVSFISCKKEDAPLSRQFDRRPVAGSSKKREWVDPEDDSEEEDQAPEECSPAWHASKDCIQYLKSLSIMPRYQVLVDLVEALPEQEHGKGREVALPHWATWTWSAKYLPQEIHLESTCFWKALGELQSARFTSSSLGGQVVLGLGLLLRECSCAQEVEEDDPLVSHLQFLLNSELGIQKVENVMDIVGLIVVRLEQSSGMKEPQEGDEGAGMGGTDREDEEKEEEEVPPVVPTQRQKRAESGIVTRGNKVAKQDGEKDKEGGENGKRGVRTWNQTRRAMGH
ncbi:hypothetical protein EDC04DRAFT_2909293 [Pisolithus marmoratus]|nr:hypothetical protein EDC04DRAFT_2909293 [Pisolithus marmoratus]